MLSYSEQKQNLIKLYKKATEAFLLRDYDIAYSLSTEAIVSLNKLLTFTSTNTNNDSTITIATAANNNQGNNALKKRIWCLYVNLIASLLSEKSPVNTSNLYLIRFLKLPSEIVAEEIWNKVIVEGFDNEEGQVPEQWLISIPDTLTQKPIQMPINETTENHNAVEDLKNYEQIIEIYILNVLPKLNDWDYAKSFLNDNDIINKDRKILYEKKLLKLKNKYDKLIKSSSSKSKNHQQQQKFGNGFIHTRVKYFHSNSNNVNVNGDA
ncbi:8094_t:CDS:2 [Entrophospora sp. SA101]|nr:8094_t:CDS:2 [Entrophospora sp. SA101]